MEKLFSLQYGLAGVCVLLTIMVLIQVGKFVWEIQRQKETISETTILKLVTSMNATSLALQVMESRLKSTEQLLGELPKIKLDLRRFYVAMKEVAGEKWPAIRDEMTKDGLTST